MNPNDRIYFWSTIMKDHAEFFLFSLSSREREYINKAEYFKNIFINMENDTKRKQSSNYIKPSIDYLNNIELTLEQFLELKLDILRQLLLVNIELNLPPTFVNHMINELMRFYNEMEDIKENKEIEVVKETMTLHKLWLPDAAGHAVSIAADLDPTEKELIKEALMFEKIFNELHIKALELNKMLNRTNLQDNSLTFLNEEVKRQINNFISYLNKIYNLRKDKKVLGRIQIIIPNHMIREEQYYLANLESIKNKRY